MPSSGKARLSSQLTSWNYSYNYTSIKNVGLTFVWIKIKVLFHLNKNWGCLPFIFSYNRITSFEEKDWDRLPFEKKEVHIPFKKKLRLSSIWKKIEVVFHLDSTKLVLQVLQSKFCYKKLFWYFSGSGQVGLGQVGSGRREQW